MLAITLRVMQAPHFSTMSRDLDIKKIVIVIVRLVS
jgi:hypothetical protein